MLIISIQVVILVVAAGHLSHSRQLYCVKRLADRAVYGRFAQAVAHRVIGIVVVAAIHIVRGGEMVQGVIGGGMMRSEERPPPMCSTPEHTILNRQAAEMLEEAGYNIQSQVQEIRLSNGGTFIPDISAADTKTAEVIFAEAERDVRASRSRQDVPLES